MTTSLQESSASVCQADTEPVLLPTSSTMKLKKRGRPSEKGLELLELIAQFVEFQFGELFQQSLPDGDAPGDLCHDEHRLIPVIDHEKEDPLQKKNSTSSDLSLLDGVLFHIFDCYLARRENDEKAAINSRKNSLSSTKGSLSSALHKLRQKNCDRRLLASKLGFLPPEPSSTSGGKKTKGGATTTTSGGQTLSTTTTDGPTDSSHENDEDRIVRSKTLQVAAGNYFAPPDLVGLLDLPLTHKSLLNQVLLPSSSVKSGVSSNIVGSSSGGCGGQKKKKNTVPSSSSFSLGLSPSGILSSALGSAVCGGALSVESLLRQRGRGLQQKDTQEDHKVSPASSSSLLPLSISASHPPKGLLSSSSPFSSCDIDGTGGGSSATTSSYQQALSSHDLCLDSSNLWKSLWEGFDFFGKEVQESNTSTAGPSLPVLMNCNPVADFVVCRYLLSPPLKDANHDDVPMREVLNDAAVVVDEITATLYYAWNKGRRAVVAYCNDAYVQLTTRSETEFARVLEDDDTKRGGDRQDDRRSDGNSNSSFRSPNDIFSQKTRNLPLSSQSSSSAASSSSSGLSLESSVVLYALLDPYFYFSSSVVGTEVPQAATTSTERIAEEKRQKREREDVDDEEEKNSPSQASLFEEDEFVFELVRKEISNLVELAKIPEARELRRESLARYRARWKKNNEIIEEPVARASVAPPAVKIPFPSSADLPVCDARGGHCLFTDEGKNEMRGKVQQKEGHKPQGTFKEAKKKILKKIPDGSDEAFLLDMLALVQHHTDDFCWKGYQTEGRFHTVQPVTISVVEKEETKTAKKKDEDEEKDNDGMRVKKEEHGDSALEENKPKGGERGTSSDAKSKISDSGEEEEVPRRLTTRFLVNHVDRTINDVENDRGYFWCRTSGGSNQSS